MDCSKCSDLLSDFLDGSLEGADRELLGKHLEECLSCGYVRQEFDQILVAANDYHAYVAAPPDSRQMWMRIRNVVEAERGFDGDLTMANSPTTPQGEGFFARLFGRRWSLTTPQLTGAFASIALVAVISGALGVSRLADRNGSPNQNQVSGGNGAYQAVAYNPSSLVERQQPNMDYWRQRVEQRRVRWSVRDRDVFDRNLNLIDQTVSESLEDLKRNPKDDVAAEMLNAALQEKMELLREFSEF